MRLIVMAIGGALALCPVTVAAQQDSPPANATAECEDGTYSTSRTARGTCSGHGGVFAWLATARCIDGSLSLSRTRQGTCSGHEGIAKWYALGACADGTVSHATTRRGACSGHGGVREWFEEP
jgi:hypothetical protein